MADPVDQTITPKVLQTPRAAGFAGVLFALLFGVIVILLRRVVPVDPHAAGTWLTKASSRRELRLALGLVPFCGIFFLWFMGAVRAHIGDAEDKFLSTVLLGSGLLFVAMLFVFSALCAALIGVAGRQMATRRSTSGNWVARRRSIWPPSMPCGWGRCSSWPRPR
jgi:hypothetical protein